MKNRFKLILTAIPLCLGTANADPLQEVYWRNFYLTPIGRWNGETIADFRQSIFSKTSGQEPANVKIGFSDVMSFYMEHTQGDYYDYIFEPYYPPAFPDNRGWETIRMMGWAVSEDARVAAAMNGMPWGDNSDQSVDNLHNFLEQADDGIYGPGGFNQIDRLGRIRSAVFNNDPTLDEVRDFAAQLEMQLSLSPYCTTVSEYWERNLRQATRILQWYREQHPDLVVNLSGSSEVTYNVHANLDYCDYSVYTKAEFRDWLQGEGLYEGSAQFASLDDLNSAYGLSFESWDSVEPPLNDDWSPDSWWSKWHEFRLHQVKALVQRQADITREMGWCPDRIYGHQISGPTGPEPGFEYRQQAAPLQSAFITGAGGGITAYLDDTQNAEINGLMYADDKNWGYFEFNPIQLSGNALIPGTKQQGDEALALLWEGRATNVAPYLWDGGYTGALAPYTIKGRPFEESLQDFMVDHFDEEPNSRKKFETAFDARSPVWTMSEGEDIEAFSSTSEPVFNKGRATFLTLSNEAVVWLNFDESSSRQILSDEYHAVEFRMNIDSALTGDSGTLVWKDTEGLSHSFDFPVTQGEHIYRINIGNLAQWREKRIVEIGMIPTGRAGATVELDWLLLRANPSWNFEDPDEIYADSGLTGLAIADGTLSGTDSNDDGFFGLSTDNPRGDNLGPEEDADRVLIDAGTFDRLRVGIDSTTTGTMEVFFWHRGDAYGEDFSQIGGIPVKQGAQTVEIPLSGNEDWSGEVTRLRLDPINTQGGSFEIDTVSIMPDLLAPRALNADHIVNSGNPVFLWDESIEPGYSDIWWEFELARDFYFQDVVTARRHLTEPRYVHPDESGKLDGHYYWRARTCAGDGSKSAWMAPVPIFVRRWDFDTVQDIIGPEFGPFTRPNDLDNGSTIEGIYTAELADVDNNGAVDPFFYLNNGNTLSRGVNADIYDRFQCRFRIISPPVGEFIYTPQFFFYDELEAEFGTVQGNLAIANGEWIEMDLDLAANPDWNAYLKYVRFDPAAQLTGGTLEIDWAQFSSSLPETSPDPIQNVDSWLIH